LKVSEYPFNYFETNRKRWNIFVGGMFCSEANSKNLNGLFSEDQLSVLAENVPLKARKSGEKHHRDSFSALTVPAANCAPP